MDNLNLLKQELECILDSKIKGHIIRAKATQIEYSEKNSKYFANLEKRHIDKKTIHKLLINNVEVTNAKDIIEEQKTFYSNLYKKQNISAPTNENSILDFELKELTEDEKNICEGILTEYECKEALFSMKNYKSPGSDGLTVEFYKAFWSYLSPYFINSINLLFHNRFFNDIAKARFNNLDS